MTVTIAKLADRLKDLPQTEQEQWLLRFERELVDAQEVYLLDDEERELIREGIADLDEGREVSGEALEAFWNRNRNA